MGDTLKSTMLDAVKRQERACQDYLMSHNILTKVCGGSQVKAELESMGFKFGDYVDGLFTEVELPPGWTKEATEHPMWIDVYDERLKRRATIFYKETSYTPVFNMYFHTRYTINSDDTCDSQGNYVEYGPHTHIKTVVKDGQAIVHTIGVCHKSDYKTRQMLREQGANWLRQNYPDWQNPTAYWD